MSLDKLRYAFTEHKEKIFISYYENFKLLVHPTIDNDDLLNRLEDDVKLLPDTQPTIDKTEIKFYRYDYNEQVYQYLRRTLSIYISIYQSRLGHYKGSWYYNRKNSFLVKK